MAAQRRKISKEERKRRDDLMWIVNWVHVQLIRRLFDEGWTTTQVVLVYEQIQREAGRIVLAHATPDLHYVCEQQVADEVYQSATGGE